MLKFIPESVLVDVGRIIAGANRGAFVVMDGDSPSLEGKVVAIYEGDPPEVVTIVSEPIVKATQAAIRSICEVNMQ